MKLAKSVSSMFHERCLGTDYATDHQTMRKKLYCVLFVLHMQCSSSSSSISSSSVFLYRFIKPPISTHEFYFWSFSSPSHCGGEGRSGERGAVWS